MITEMNPLVHRSSVKMNICLIGESSNVLDEAMRKSTYFFYKYLQTYHNIKLMDVRQALTPGFWKSLRENNPDVFHYVTGPSINSFVMLKAISIHYPNAKTVMSAMHPDLYLFHKGLVKLLKPDMVLVQSYLTECWFKSIGCLTKFLPSGVETDRFVPAIPGIKKELRKKYGLEPDKFIILHVGSIKAERNVERLIKLQGNERQVIVIGAKSTGIEGYTLHKLRESGCVVFTDFYPRIEEFYMLSDCYVFPAQLRHGFNSSLATTSIEMPLSVLEAMSCNLPVVSTHFGPLPRVFDEGDGLIFSDDESGMIQGVETLQRGLGVKTRQKVLAYSWKKIVKDLADIYSGLASDI